MGKLLWDERVEVTQEDLLDPLVRARLRRAAEEAARREVRDRRLTLLRAKRARDRRVEARLSTS